VNIFHNHHKSPNPQFQRRALPHGATRRARRSHVTRTGASDAITVVLKDRLGSTLATLDGSSVTRRAFDAFGKARNGDLSDRANGSLNLADTIHGFTTHTHADAVALIHMNGRVFDPNLGRFLSVDPIIGDGSDSQALNPYAYLRNSPFAGTDPTGYAQCLTTDAPSCASDAVNTVTNPGSGQKTTLIVGDKGTHFQLTDNLTNKSKDFTIGGNGAEKIDFSSILAKNTSPDKIQSLTSKDLGPAKSAAMLSECAYGSCTGRTKR